MNRDDLDAYVWQKLSARKHLAGRRIVNRIVARAVKGWPTGVLQHCDDKQADIVGIYMARSLGRSERQEVGMGILATLILSALVSEIVKVLIRWWMESRENRVAMLELSTRD